MVLITDRTNETSHSPAALNFAAKIAGLNLLGFIITVFALLLILSD